MDTAQRITDAHLAHWRRHGYALVPGFLDAAELAAARAAIDAIAPDWATFAADPSPTKNPWRVHDFPYGHAALDRISFAPAILRFVERALGTPDLAVVASQVVVKYLGADNRRFEQELHVDYPNNTLVVPRDDDGFGQVALIIYHTDVELSSGPTYVVPRDAHTETLVPRHVLPRGEFPEYYRDEIPVTVPAGTALFYSMTTFHRGSAATATSGVRIHQTQTYRAAAHRWMDFIAWPFRSGPALDRFLIHASPRERTLIGFPPPGHRYWNAATIAGVGQRYPGMDMRPYAEAVVALQAR